MRVAAAQLAGFPDELLGGRTARSLNRLLLTGNAQERSEAEHFLAEIDVMAVRKYSIYCMMNLMKKAALHSCDVIVFPELALTSFFPYFYLPREQTLLRFFEKTPIECGVAQPLFQYAQELGIGLGFGFAEYVECEECKEDRMEPGSHSCSKRYNTYVLFDTQGNLFTYRKTHIPGFAAPRPGEDFFQFEKGQFHSSQDGYPVYAAQLSRDQYASSPSLVNVGMLLCHDRRYNAPYLIMGLQNVEIIVNGFNTPFTLPFARTLEKNIYRFHYLPLQAQAITEGTFIISVARAGDVFGVKQIAGTCIIDPQGEILCKTESLSEQLLIADLDLGLCETVKAQKYWGERAEAHVALKELERLLKDNGDCLSH